MITAVLPSGMESSAVSSGLKSNVRITENLGLSDGGSDKCVKVTIGKGFEAMNTLDKINRMQGQMFEISFEEGAVVNGTVLSMVAEGLKSILRESPEMVYQISRNYPNLPAKNVIIDSRAILSRYVKGLDGTELAQAVKGLSDERIGSLLAEFEAFGKKTDTVDQNSPFFDKLKGILDERGTAPKADTAAKVALLVMGTGEAALTKDYLETNNRKGFESDTDRLAFGQALWTFENMKDEVLAKGPANYIDIADQSMKNNKAGIACSIEALIITGKKAVAEDMLPKFLELAKNDPAALALYAGLMNDMGKKPDAEIINAALGAYSGDMATIVRCNLKGEWKDIGDVLERLNPALNSNTVLKTVDDFAQFAIAYVGFGDFTVSETVKALSAAQARIEQVTDKNSPAALIGEFKVLDLLSDTKTKFEKHQKKEVINSRLVSACLGAG